LTGSLVVLLAESSRQCLLIAAMGGAGYAGHSRMQEYDAILRWLFAVVRQLRTMGLIRYN